MAGSMVTVALGPFVKGCIDRAEASQALTGVARSLKHLRLTGANRLSITPGTRVVQTLKDFSNANITSVCAIVPFTDGALIVGHSTGTSECYLYRLNATLDTWTASGGSTTTSATAQPVATLWSGIPNSPDVMVAEGLGVAYICHTQALDSASLSFPMKAFTDSTRGMATVRSDLDNDTSAETLYFTGCASFQQHLWAWGFGAGTSAADGYRPELARFSQPNFETSPQLFNPPDSITLGHRVRSLREGILGGFVAGGALYLGAPYLVTRVTGYGRSSWFKKPLDSSYGFVGPKCAVAVGGTLYYWSPRGPMRVSETTQPEPLFDPIASLVETVVNPQAIVAGFDTQTDAVIFAFDTGGGTRTWAAFDISREVWLGPDNDFGITLYSMGAVSPIYTSTAAPTLGPLGAPTSASTAAVGSTTATANWVAGDGTSPTMLQIRQQGASPWTTASTIGAGLLAYTFTDLSVSVAYEWRAAHVKDGQTSSFLGPVAGTQFTTAAPLTPLLPPTSPQVIGKDDDGSIPVFFTDHANLNVSWTNSPEAGTTTTIEMSTDGVAYFVQQGVGSGVASAVVVVNASGTYYFRMKHSRPGYADSATTSPVSINITIV